jgi:hypothetical protein
LLTAVKKVTREYYAEYKRAAKTKELNPARLHLYENATLTGNYEFLDGKKAIIEALEKFFTLVSDANIQHQYFDHESSCTILDVITIIPEIVIKTTIRLVVVDEGITEIYIYYDTLPWKNLMHKLQNQSSVVDYFQKAARNFQKATSYE